DSLPNGFQQPPVIDGVEIAPDVTLQGPDVAHRERLADDLHGVRGRAPRPVPEGGLTEVRLEYRLQHQPRRLLDHPVPHRRNPQPPRTAVWLRDVPPPDRRRVVPACSERALELL